MTPELTALCSAAVEGRLSANDAARLEELTLSDPAAMKFYAGYAGLHAALTWSAGDPRALGGNAHDVTIPSPTPPRRRMPWGGWAVAAGLLVAVGGLTAWTTTRGPAAVATLTDANSCKWESGTLPTEAGAKLTAGRLRLAEGVARVAFASGAEVRLEGPADLELVDGNRCVLHAGRLVASVPPQAIGFVVDTPTAVLTDYGTEFGVNVRDGKTADVQVFNGIVDGSPRESGATVRMTTGQSRRFRPDGATPFDPQKDERPPAVPDLPAGQDQLTLSTATGQGKDAYIYSKDDPVHRSDIMLLVKNQMTSPNSPPYNRKAYLGIDLGPVAGRRVVDAQLTFTLDKTDMGFASEVPDATFAVYGLTDEAQDGWGEKTIRWENAPANRPGGVALDPAKVVKLGTFEVAQGVYSGTRTLGGPAVAEFLNRDTNKAATFILVRETVGSPRASLVHGFANKRHPTLPPPTLKLTVARN